MNRVAFSPAQAHQLWSQTYILQGRRWKIFIGSEIQFKRTFLRPHAFKLGQNPSQCLAQDLETGLAHKVVHWARLRTVFSLIQTSAETIESVLGRLQACDLLANHRPGICNLSSLSSNCLKHYGKKWPLFPKEENLGAINNV